MCEQVPEDPLNSVINMIHIPMNAVPGTTKYSVAEVEAKKVIPIKILQMENLCTSALCVTKLWYLGAA